ncbi:tRNA lysidine(34) synthetase TilS [Runella salmonicolor]|uniref:tRNA(Ile)-lysidine synthase n=1 Tax=Runella salmonicolor TaxID=2950278 RepID=A0ABT1FP68_9BACT|nr:tRNA lysidine(34) synthetase TilS [Runella salmonicolor]MCP1382353.1 tRNA lysidine(34) synthetase TilS [Runella salmonicolor]
MHFLINVVEESASTTFFFYTYLCQANNRPMLQAFLRFITENQLFTPTDRLLLTVSGGIDSVVLTQLCHEAGFSFGIAHCNFQLRGEDSEGDQLFVQQLAQKYGVDCHVQRFETKAFAKKRGISTQMAARELRYPWFEEIRQQFRYDYILTAHHQDDLLETVLLNLTRGTGLAGLHGILPKKDRLVRPLLFALRNNIQAFLTQNQLPWREDSSNASVDYARNRLRHHVVPILRELNPNVAASVATLAERVKATENLLAASRKTIEAEIIWAEGSTIWIAIAPLEQQVAPVELLAQWLTDFGFTYQQSKLIWLNRKGQTGKRYFSPTHTLVMDRGKWLVAPTQTPSSASYELNEPSGEINYGGGHLTWTTGETTFIENKNEVAYMDADALTFPLKLRLWQPGDWFCPLGMKGKRKKISDFLVDAKVPRNQKNQVYVLESDGEIAWLVGLRLDERFKISETTVRILKFSQDTSN